jgi:hypothetical protein
MLINEATAEPHANFVRNLLLFFDPLLASAALVITLALVGSSLQVEPPQQGFFER